MRKWAFILFYSFLIFTSTGLLHLSSVSAQDESEEFFDDESGDEGFDGGEVEEPADSQQGSQRQLPRNSRFGGGASSGGGSSPSPSYSGGGSSGDAVEFRLVDPPKYWKPKKRKLRPPVTSRNEAK